MNGHDRHHNSETQSIEDGARELNKRKSDDGSSSHIRAKRNRYVSIACNECKRRKIKCNGQVPCQRCGNLSLDCFYAPNCCTNGFKDSEEFRIMNASIQSLQDQVDSLYSTINALNNTPDSSGLLDQRQESYTRQTSLPRPTSQPSYQNSMSPSHPRGKHPRFQGPTSTAFNFDVANSSLQTMGITDGEPPTEEALSYDENSLSSPPQHRPAVASVIAPPSPKDPIWKVGKDEAIRLCRVYEEEVGITSPILDIEKVISKATALFEFSEPAMRTALKNRSVSADFPDADDIIILKIILAITLTIEGCGQSEIGLLLFDSVRESFESKFWEPAESKGLILLVIIALYHFHLDDEIQSYRFIGLAARLALEMGMHRREIFSKIYPIEEEFCWAIKLFWTIYVLDRRFSFGTGMPFAIQDTDIDPSLPEPDGSTPYLTAMISYSRISSNVWCSVSNIQGSRSEIKKDNIGYLDYQILQWQKSIPEALRFYPSESVELTVPNRGQRRLQVLLYLRCNQMRILIYRPVLHSATSIMDNRHYAQAVVEVAKDTIRILTCLNQTTDIYRSQQICFNYFLISALAVLFLAVSHAPLEFNRQVRDEFYMALDLVKGFSTRSYISTRLWMTIKGLKEVGPKLGMVSRPALPDSIDPHSSAAVAMAGLAGHAVDEMAVFPTLQGPSPLGSSPVNGQQMSYELTNLFEAAGGYGNVVNPNTQGIEGVNGFVGTQGEISQVGEGLSGSYGNVGEFARIMRDLF